MSIDADVQAIVDGGEEADEILRASLAAVHEGVGRALERDRVRRGAPDGDRPAARHGARRLARARARRADRLPRRHRRRAVARRHDLAPSSRPSSRAPPRCSPPTASSAGTPAARTGCPERLDESRVLDLRARPLAADVRLHRGGAGARRSGARGPAGSLMPVNLKSKSSPAAVSKSTRPTPSMRSRKLW